jgi:hypothetical protein
MHTLSGLTIYRNKPVDGFVASRAWGFLMAAVLARGRAIPEIVEWA